MTGAVASGRSLNVCASAAPAPKGACCGEAKKLAEFERKNQAHLAYDSEGSLAFLAPSEWRLNYVAEQWPDIVFAKTREHQ